MRRREESVNTERSVPKYSDYHHGRSVFHQITVENIFHNPDLIIGSTKEKQLKRRDCLLTVNIRLEDADYFVMALFLHQ